RFRARFYRPELIRRVLQFGGPIPALKELDRLSGAENKLIDIQHSLPPKVTLTATPSAESASDDTRYQIQAVAAPADGDSIRSLRLLIDGRPGPETHDAEALTASPVPEGLGSGSATQFSWTINLTPGNHQLIVKAESSRSIGLSDPVNVVVAPQ